MDKTIGDMYAKHVWEVEGELPNAVDPNVNSVVKSYLVRAKQGMDKYGVTTERKDIDLLGWLQHLQEELMDATIYIERLKKEVQHAGK